LEEFKGQFIPHWVVERKEDEFQNFGQESRIVGRYVAEFTRLSKYCLLLVQAEADRMKRFIRGLRPQLKRTLIRMALPTYSVVVEITSRIEGEDLE
jgi:hypothetical protein